MLPLSLLLLPVAIVTNKMYAVRAVSNDPPMKPLQYTIICACGDRPDDVISLDETAGGEEGMVVHDRCCYTCCQLKLFNLFSDDDDDF